VEPTQVPPNCTLTSLKTADGLYTVNDDGTVTFNPDPDFVGVVTQPVNYQVADGDGVVVSATITPTVGLPPAPEAFPEVNTDDYDTNQTFSPLANDKPGAESFPLLTSSLFLCADGESPNDCSATTLTIEGEGTYTVNSDGTVTFDPLPTFTGEATPVVYQATDALNRTVSSTITPTVLEPPINAVPDTSSGAHDTNQIISPLLNDTPGAQWIPTTLKLCADGDLPNDCSATTLTIEGEGTYTVNSDGTVTFDPLPTFTGEATPVVYQATDVLNRTASSTITPTVSDPPVPSASPETKVLAPGDMMLFTHVIGTGALASGAGLQHGIEHGPCIIDPATNVCGTTVVIPDEGTWTIDQTTGVATFASLSSITHGTKTSVEYVVTDVLGRQASSYLTPIIPPPPSASDDALTNGYDINQIFSPLTNDSFSSLAPAVASTLKLCADGESPNTCSARTLTIEGEGTYTVNSNGTVTFNPLPTFVGTATSVRYQVSNTVGQVVNAVLTPTVLPPPLPSATDDLRSAREGNSIVFSAWLNDKAGSTSLSLVPTTLRLCPLGTVIKTEVFSVPRANASCTLTRLTTADGTYTVDIRTGRVTFVHREGFSGTVTQPVTYQIANNWKGPFGAAYTTARIIPTIISNRIPSVTVGDKVWRDVHGDGYQGRKDRGIPNVRVTLRTITGKRVVDIFGNPVKPQLTDKAGKYLFTDLPAGRYVVSVKYPRGLRPTIAERPGRNRNSSTGKAVSRYLRLGQSDLSLDFGMVGIWQKPKIPVTK